MMKAGCVLIMHWSILTSQLAAGEIPVVPAAEAGLSAAKLAEVDKFMEHQVADKKIAGGIVIVAHDGKIGFFHAYGQMDVEANQPMRPDTIFRIYSMSKAITTAAALNLVDAGKIGVDDPVSKYIPSFADLKVATTSGLRAPKRPMTVRDLMLHTSGLTYGSGPDALKEAADRLKPLESTDLKEMAAKLAQVPLAFDPGTDWTYGVSIDVLGRVIEVASGESLDVFLRKTIFDPLDMPDTAFNVPPEKLSRFAANYARSTGGLKVIDVPAKSKYADKVTFFSGGGGLVGNRQRLPSFPHHDSKRRRAGRTSDSPSGDGRSHDDQPTSQGSFPHPLRQGQAAKASGFGFGFSVRTENTRRGTRQAASANLAGEAPPQPTTGSAPPTN